jgi:hypothetical protein
VGGHDIGRYHCTVNSSVSGADRNRTHIHIQLCAQNDLTEYCSSLWGHPVYLTPMREISECFIASREHCS